LTVQNEKKKDPQIVAGMKLPQSINGANVRPELLERVRAIRRKYKPLMDALQKV